MTFQTEICEDRKENHKYMKEKINLTLDSEIKEKLCKQAENKGLSVSAYITSIVMNYDNPMQLIKNPENITVIESIQTLQSVYNELDTNDNSLAKIEQTDILKIIEFQKNILRNKGYSDETFDFCIYH